MKQGTIRSPDESFGEQNLVPDFVHQFWGKSLVPDSNKCRLEPFINSLHNSRFPNSFGTRKRPVPKRKTGISHKLVQI